MLSNYTKPSVYVCMLGMMRRDEVDKRALDGLRGLTAEAGLSVLAELKGSALQSVSNKSAYMCGIMKSLRQKAAAGLLTEDTKRPGPDEEKLKVRTCSPWLICVKYRVPMPPGKCWNFFVNFPGPGKSWKMILVLEI